MNEALGLVTETGVVPLTGVAVRGEIAGRSSRVRVAQRFHNTEQKPIEAVYRFPLPDGAAICGFRANIGGRVVKGQVEEREKAFEIYDEALAAGHGGYLIDEERPNIFTLSVGNLNPGAEVVIEIDYVALLDTEGTKLRFLLPTTISPRYVPDGMPERDGIPEEGRITPPYAADVPYGITISLDIRGAACGCSVESPSHPIGVTWAGGAAHVALSAASVKMDHDFVLYIDRGEAFVSRAYRCNWDGENFVQLDLCLGEKPTQQAADKREVIFLLDCSGSMGGDSITEAKRALDICLRGLADSCAFNVICYGSRFKSFFDKPLPYGGANLESALQKLTAADADLGGTELMAPLQHVLSAPLSDGIRREIILLTDGQVGNEQEVFGLVEAHRAATRLFAIGIGAGPNEHLVKGLARAGNGAFAFVYPNERIEPKVLEMFGKVMQQPLAAPSIEWSSPAVQAPAAPVVFQGSPLTVFAHYGKDPAPGSITVSAKLNGGQHWEIGVSDVPPGVAIPQLWARERIRDLEESDRAGRGSRQEDRKRLHWQADVLEISKRFGVMSSLASYVAVEERSDADRTQEQAELRKVPVLVTVGWHGLGSIAGRGTALRLQDKLVLYALEACTKERPWKACTKEERLCDKCGAAMVIRISKNGKFLACSAFPKCRYTLPLDDGGEEPLNIDVKCEKCGLPMVVKSGSRGKFLACSGYPECKNTASLAGVENGETPKKRTVEETDQKCEKCGSPMVIRTGRHGKFAACSAYPKCRNKKPVHASGKIAQAVFSILSHQRAEGGFELDADTARNAGIDLAALDAAAGKLKLTAAGFDGRILAHTAVVLQILETCFAAERSRWEGVAKKSRDWFDHAVKASNPTIDGKSLRDWADEFVRANVRLQ